MRKFKPFILLLAAVMLLSTVSFVPVTAAPASLDYSDPNSPVKTEMSASELLEFILGGSIPAVEADYLNGKLGHVLFYSEFVPTKNVAAVYKDDVLTVAAEKYEYTSPAGKVSWIPEKVTFLGEEKPLTYSASSGKYECTVNKATGNTEAALSVSYTCTLTVGAEAANEYVNFTYNKAVEIWNKNKENAEAIAAHREATTAYEEYLKVSERYNTRKRLWENYQKDLIDYEKDFKEYEEYKVAYAEYLEKNFKYLGYLTDLEGFKAKLEKYNNYVNEKTIYEGKLKEYQLYAGEINKALAKLDVINSVFVTDSQNKQLYATLMGPLVNQVLSSVEANIGALETAGSSISKAEVLATKEVTEEIRGLLSGYKAQTNDLDRFYYYKANYTAIKNCFTSLYGALHKMYNDAALKTALYNYDGEHARFFRYIQFLSQLYVVATGLDDSTMRDSGWYVKGEPDKSRPFEADACILHYYSNELESCQIPNDNNNADPSDIRNLPDSLEPPTPPTPVEEPVMPDPVEQPIEPDMILEPIVPTPVENPGEPPEVVEAPGDAPEKLHLTAEEQSLVDAINNETLKERPAVSAKSFTINTTVDKTIVPDTKCSISFFDYDGRTLLYSYTAEKGNKITYSGSAPKRGESDKFTYEFEGWKDENGKLITDLGNATESHMAFYASYKSTVKTFTVTWIVDGEKRTDTYEYGQVPYYGETPYKPGTNRCSYVFSGWSKPLATVTGDATYEAIFEEVERRYSVTWVYGENTYTENYEYADLPKYKYGTDKFSDGEYIYEFAGWDKEIKNVDGDVTYTAQFNKTNILEDIGGEDLKIQMTDKTFTATAEKNEVDISKLVDHVAERNGKIVISFTGTGAELSMSAAAVAKLAELDCSKVYIYINEENLAQGCFASYKAGFLKADGTDLGSLGTNVTLTIPAGDSITSATKVYSADGNTLASVIENGKLTLKLDKSTEIMLKNEYKITVIECKNGVLSADKMISEVGGSVSVSLTFTDSYERVFLKVVGESGTEYALDENGCFVMPEENVTVSAELKLREFTIRFESDGKVISEQIYHKGDTVTLPEDPVKADEGNKIYTFIGWTPVITTVTEDATYVAEFKESIKTEENPYFEDEPSSFYLRITLLIIGVVVLLIGTPVAIVLTVKYNKKKKAAEKKDEAEEKKDESAESEESSTEGENNSTESEE